MTAAAQSLKSVRRLSPKRYDKIVVFGGGGHGRVVLDILLEAGSSVLGFVDEDKTKWGNKIRGIEVLGNLECLTGKKDLAVALGIGNNIIREKIFNRIQEMELGVAQAIHPKAVLSKDVRLGEGVVIMPGAVVNTGSILEDGVVVNTGATVDHDCHLKSFSHIWPGAHLAGTVEVGERSYIGTGASVIQNLRIGADTIIGAGAAVVDHIPNRVVAVGVPAKPIKRNNA